MEMNCPKCSFSDDRESEVRMHSLFTHQFFMPQCSTTIAKQSFIDYDKIRANYHELQDKISRNKLNLYYIPYKWQDAVSKIRNNLKHGYKWNDYQVYDHVNALPDYLRKDIVVRIKKEITLESTMNTMKEYIKQEGIVV